MFKRLRSPFSISLLLLFGFLSFFFYQNTQQGELPAATQTASTKSSRTSSGVTTSGALSDPRSRQAANKEQLLPLPVSVAKDSFESRLRRGANQRLLFEPAVLTKRKADPQKISPEELFLPFQNQPTGPLTFNQHTLSAVEAKFNEVALTAFLDSEDGSFALPLSAESQVLVRIDEVVTRGEETTTLLGQVVDHDFSDVLLVFHDGAVAGSVAFHGTNTHFEFGMAGHGSTIAIRRLDPYSYQSSCGSCVHPGDLIADAATDEPAEEVIEEEIQSAPAGSNPFDIVVGYSAEARQSDGGTAAIEARIIGSVDRLNLAIDNSEAGEGFCALLATIEDPDTSFTDSSYSDMADILVDLRQGTNGVLDTIYELQGELGADQATFVCNGAISGTAGIAGRPGAYCVVARNYMSSTRLTFSHEVGHNLGLRHAWGDSGNSSTNPKNVDNYGWRFRDSSGTKISTIMAYNSGWVGSRIPYFSNPDVTYDGMPTGAVDGFDATDNSTNPAYDQQLVEDGIVGGLGQGFDGSNSQLGARNGPYIRNNTQTMVNRATQTALAVLDPPAGSELEPGDLTTIFWYGGDHSDSVALDLYQNGTFHSPIATGLTGEERWFDWTIPTLRGSGFTVQITLNGSSTASSGEFTIAAPVESLPYAEDFEAGMGSWRQSSDDDYDWTHHSGGTDSPAAGPEGASSGSYYLYAEGHDAGAYETSSIECAFNFRAVRQTSLSFDYHMYGAYIDYLAVDVHDGTEWTNDVWVKDGQQHANSAASWSSATVDLTAFSGNDEVIIRFRTANLRWNSADPAIDNLHIEVGPITLPYTESFESGMGGWTQSQDDDYDWTVHSGETTSPAAGPSSASDGDYYLYAEGHDADESYQTSSVEARFDLSTANSVELTFDYHLYGAYIDYLSVDVNDGTGWVEDVWTRSRAQHSANSDAWTEALVDLTPYVGNSEVTIRFRTAILVWFSADPAIDNIKIYEPVGPLVAYWPLDERSGTTLTDQESPHYEASHTGASWVTGIQGTALEFDGTSSTATLPVDAFATIEDQITLSLWVYGGTDQPRQDTLFYAVDADGDRVLNVHLPWGNGLVYWDAGQDEGFDRISKSATATEYRGQWNHWIFTKDANAGDMAIYLNGELWHSETGLERPMSGITAATLGSQIDGDHYSGILDEVRLYNVSFDATAAAELFASYTTENGVPFGWLMSFDIDPSETGAQANVDADELTNETEWLFGTDPLTSDSPIRGLSTTAGELTFNYTRRTVDGVDIRAEWSPDLTESSWLTTGLTEVISSVEGDIETVTVTVPMDEARKFIRVKVVE